MLGALKNEGHAMPDPARGAWPAGGGNAAALLPGTRPAAPEGLPPRNRPIYYVWQAPPDHGVWGKNKTAGRGPAVFAKYGVWSMGQGKT